MKQLVLNYDSGELRIEDVPVPICKPGGVLVRTAYSLVSAGTERMKVSQARMNLVQMAKARPDKVKQVIKNVKQTGLVETYRKVRERLASLTPLGYSLAGVVQEVGRAVDELAVGDVVACAGEAIACHAEFVFVPRNLCVKVAADVDPKDAAFSTVGAIAMNGVRQAGVCLGDSVMVIGLGLVGLLGVQILKAAGCRVIGMDIDSTKLELAKQCGADLTLSGDVSTAMDAIETFTNGFGVDVVYIAASTKTSEPMDLAGKVLRDRGKVVIVGMLKVEADWRTYYSKEISVIMSRSYGPGRYDRNFEQKGIDYPVGYVRWTERRNLEEFVRLLDSGSVKPKHFGFDVVGIENAPSAYKQLQASSGQSVGILFEYSKDAPLLRRVQLSGAKVKRQALDGSVGIGIVGAGNFTTATIIPSLKKIQDVRFRSICSAGGLSARSAGDRHGFECCTSDLQHLLDDEEIHAVIIATRHDTHSRFAADALRAGKHVFVEKPLALNGEQLDEIISAQAESGKIVMPGFNRRFSPLSIAVRDFFAKKSSPIEVICRVNAGKIKADSWYQDAEEGGWRIISEGCHFVDLIQFICGSAPKNVSARMVAGTVRGGQNDNCVVTMQMDDGSLGIVIYVANGDPSFEKERIEVFGQGKTAVIENFRRALLVQNGRTRTVRAGASGKGHQAELEAFIRAVKDGGASPIPTEEARAVTEATFAAAKSCGMAAENNAADLGST